MFSNQRHLFLLDVNHSHVSRPLLWNLKQHLRFYIIQGMVIVLLWGWNSYCFTEISLGLASYGPVEMLYVFNPWMWFVIEYGLFPRWILIIDCQEYNVQEIWDMEMLPSEIFMKVSWLQIPHLRPAEYKRSRLARNRRTVNRAYGGVLSGGAVRER